MKSIIFRNLQQIIEDRIGRSVSGTDPLTSMGIDSIEFVELIVEIENKFDFVFPIDRLSMDSFNNIDELAELVSELCNMENEQS